ncbi:hypothetical protein ONE63_003492 [Megalurothrips usitatus]|uniref:Uncharacterized protein n=1 Tax=Megalurothrips usitatus TaxID=439358 RepID=A0AAV7X7E7_9NEOP|nr:hypothetical protein ONE63_003492 [Megalurothrips usitatus]
MFFEIPGVLDQILSYMDGLERDNKLVLPLTLSFDDVATNKDLGSHATVHKLSACHLTISCLPPVYQSSLENLFFVLLFHAADKDFGLEEVFRPLLDELKDLQTNGIEVSINNVSRRIYFALCLLIGDNLGLNTILGLVQGFSANYFCRICKSHKEATEIQTVERADKLRTIQNYEHDLNRRDQISTGIKSKCIWNELSGFHITVNIYLDIMHDIIEGIGVYDMSFVIEYMVKIKKLLTFQELNELVQGFYYGLELGNKPPLISDDNIKKESVGFNATEMLCLIRFFPLMVGHKIDNDDKVWQFYLSLRELVDLLFAPTFSRSSIPYLIDLVAEHHSQYMALSKRNLRPKYHNAVHMGRVISKVGPLKPLWTMRTEAKYKEIRQAAHVTSSRIKIDYTLSVKASLKLCGRLLTNKGLMRKFDYSPHCEEVSVRHLNEYVNFVHHLPANHDTWNIVKWVNVNGTLYKPGMVVVVSVGETFPNFGVINTISVVAKQAKFLLKKLITRNFNSHLHSYRVSEDVSWDSWYFVNQEDLVTYSPANVRTFFDGSSYVMLRYAV